MRWIARGGLSLVALLLACGGALCALTESREVVILHAADATGACSRLSSGSSMTRACSGCAAAGPSAAGSCARANPAIELERAGETRAYSAVIVETPEATVRVNELMREKYGWIDALIERIEGGWQPIAVRLDPR